MERKPILQDRSIKFSASQIGFNISLFFNEHLALENIPNAKYNRALWTGQREKLEARLLKLQEEAGRLNAEMSSCKAGIERIEEEVVAFLMKKGGDGERVACKMGELFELVHSLDRNAGNAKKIGELNTFLRQLCGRLGERELKEAREQIKELALSRDDFVEVSLTAEIFARWNEGRIRRTRAVLKGVEEKLAALDAQEEREAQDKKENRQMHLPLDQPPQRLGEV